MICRVMQKVKYNGWTQSCQNHKGYEVTNNLDPDQASMVVFPDTMYTYRDTKGVYVDCACRWRHRQKNRSKASSPK